MSKYMMIKNVFDGCARLTIIQSLVNATIEYDNNDDEFIINLNDPDKEHCAKFGAIAFQELFGLSYQEISISDFNSEAQMILIKEMSTIIANDLETTILAAINNPSDCYKLDFYGYMDHWKEYFIQRATQEDMKPYLKTKQDNP
ncbi:MAG: hypothetical protein MJZ12_00820 [Prevotella sp.]|nr:hypothetical protein [Prevotella sp.]